MLIKMHENDLYSFKFRNYFFLTFKTARDLNWGSLSRKSSRKFSRAEGWKVTEECLMSISFLWHSPLFYLPFFLHILSNFISLRNIFQIRFFCIKLSSRREKKKKEKSMGSDQSGAFCCLLNFTKHPVGQTMKSSFNRPIHVNWFFLFAFHCVQSIFFISRKIDCYEWDWENVMLQGCHLTQPN